MKNSKKMKEIIEKKRELSEEKTPKYGTRKLSIGLVSCMLGFSLIIAPGSSKAADGTDSTDTAKTEVSDKKIPDAPVVETKTVEKTEEETATSVENSTETTPAVEEVVKAKQADTFTANLQILTVDQGQSVEDYKKAITNLPQDAKLGVQAPVDTKEAGEKTVNATITFSDGSTKEVVINVNVNPVEKTEDENALELSPKEEKEAVAAGKETSEEFTEDKAKENWDKDVQDKSRWAIGKDQRLVRVGYSDPIKMSDIDYDGVFQDADGNTVIRLVYKERESAETVVWYRARFNFGELDQFIDYNKSYVVGSSLTGNEKGRYNLIPVNDRKEREINLYDARGDITNARYNLPINLVLKDKMTVADLVKKNYTVQMRLTDKDGKRIYAYAPKKTSMDYSTYTKTTSVALEDNINNTFLKGGKQKDGNNATSQETFFSEFIANPKEYSDESQLGIIRTQYYGNRSGLDASPEVG